MSVETELAHYTPEKDTLITIGVFDGVHLGHQSLIAELVRQAKQQDLIPIVVTFHQHPQEVLSPGEELFFLGDMEERIALLKAAGAQIVVPLSFTPELSRFKARDFLSLVKKHLRMRGLVVGPDFALGYGRNGTIERVRAMGKEMGFTVSSVPPFILNGEVVSSTAIREAMSKGDMQKVIRMVGRPFSLRNVVVSGAGRGSRLGFPTANLTLRPWQAAPPDGVYATQACVNGDIYPALTYIGKSPTFGDKERMAEVYLLDYNKNIYGHELRADLIEKLRGDIKFTSIDELRNQIAEDVRRGQEILQARGDKK